MSSKRVKTFVPSHLANREPYVTYTLLSPNYYRVANELRGFVHQPPGKWPGHYYVFPTVVMFMSCLEAFFQEHLTYSRGAVERRNPPGMLEQLQRIDSLRESRPPFKDFKDWLKEVFRMYDPTGKGIDTDCSEYANALALKELRNAVAHYNPVFIEHTKWPARLEQAFRCAKPGVVNADWVTNFSCIEVADWAHETVRGVVVLFCKKSGAECPFTSTYENGLLLW